MFIYPNPVSGTEPVTIQVTLTRTEPLVRIGIYTLSFRKVNEVDRTQVPAGVSEIAVPLTDKAGKPLANGIYYVVFQAPQGRLVAKLLILR